MKPLIARQERFCQAFVRNGNASAAAYTAGYAMQSAGRQGWRLLRSPRIQARIRELQVALGEHQGRDCEELIGKLEVTYFKALSNGQYHAAIRAAEAQARLMRSRALTEAARDHVEVGTDARHGAVPPPAVRPRAVGG